MSSRSSPPPNSSEETKLIHDLPVASLQVAGHLDVPIINEGHHSYIYLGREKFLVSRHHQSIGAMPTNIIQIDHLFYSVGPHPQVMLLEEELAGCQKAPNTVSNSQAAEMAMLHAELHALHSIPSNVAPWIDVERFLSQHGFRPSSSVTSSLGSGHPILSLVNSLGETPFVCSVKTGKLAILKSLYSRNTADLVTYLNNDSLVFTAIESGNLEVLLWLVEQGCSISNSQHNKKGMTPIECAIMFRHQHIIEWMKSADKVSSSNSDQQPLQNSIFDFRDEHGNNLALIAARHGNMECLQWLLKDGWFSSSSTNDHGSTLVHLASEGDNLALIQWLISDEGGHLDLKATNKDGWNVLDFAAESGAIGCMEWCISQGFELNTYAASGTQSKFAQSLLKSAMFNSLPTLDYLFRHGWRLDMKDEKGWGAMQYAAHFGSISAIEWLETRGMSVREVDPISGCNLLHIAARAGQLEMAKYLVEKRTFLVSELTQDAEHRNVFQEAVAGGFLPVVSWLLESQPSEPGYVNANGMNAVDLAALHARVDILDYLMSKTEIVKYDVHSMNKKGSSCVHLAAQGAPETSEAAQVATLEWLAARGCDLNQANLSNATAMHRAALSGCLRVMMWLFSKGVSLRTLTNKGVGIVHCAASSGKVSCLSWLVTEQHLSLTDLTFSNEKPAHYSAQGGHVDVLKWIHAQDQNLILGLNDGGWSCLHQAAFAKSIPCFEFLLSTKLFSLHDTLPNGMNLTYIAASVGGNGAIEVLRWLQTQGLSLSTPLPDGRSLIDATQDPAVKTWLSSPQ